MPRRILPLCLALATMVAVVLCASPALAWGPGVHVAVGNFLLSNAHLLAAKVAQTILAHPNMFLYGALSADIFIGKGSKIKPGHSHNWSTGMALLKSAREAEVKSYALGYLTHLAADILAHNYFVPNMLGRAAGGGKINHVLIEMQADQRMTWNNKHAARLFSAPVKQADASLLLAMNKRRFPFVFKKQLFQHSLLLSRHAHAPSISFVNKLPETEMERDLPRLLDLTLRLVVDFLNNLDQSTALHFDPIGDANLSRIKELRRHNGNGKLAPGHYFPIDQRLFDLPPIYALNKAL